MITVPSGIYMIRNTKDGKYYIGSAVDLSKRQKQHWNALRAGRHLNRHLQAAWNRDGEAAFSFFTLAFVADKARLIEFEQGYIDSYMAHRNKCGYNARPQAGSNFGTRIFRRDAGKGTSRKSRQAAVARADRKAHGADERAQTIGALFGTSPPCEARRSTHGRRAMGTGQVSPVR